MPDDVVSTSESYMASGGSADTVYFLMNPETGHLVTPVVPKNQTPVDGAVTASFEFERPPTEPVKVVIYLSVARAFPMSETTAWVVEMAPDRAAGGWSQRTLLPSGDTP
jgi:hypothetical protein